MLVSHSITYCRVYRIITFFSMQFLILSLALFLVIVHPFFLSKYVTFFNCAYKL